MPGRQTRKMHLADLHQHAVQSDYLVPMQDAVLTAKAAVVSESGQQRPVQILTDGTVLAGWDEVEVAEALGHEAVNAVVREDLDGDELEAERVLINDALANRPLRRLETFALLCRQTKIELAAWRSNDFQSARPQSLQELARKWLGIGKREVHRFKKILELARPIRLAAAGDYLGVRLAHDLVGLKAEFTEQIVERIESQGIESAEETVYSVLPEWKSTSDDPAQGYRKLVRALQRAVSQLGDRVEEICDTKRADVDVLDAAKKLIPKLLRHVRQSVTRRETEWEASIQESIERLRGDQG